MDLLDVGTLAKIMSQLDRTADYGTCSCVCKAWSEASAAVRPVRLEMRLRKNLSNDDFISMIRWLRCRMTSLHDISVHSENEEYTYGLLSCIGCCAKLTSVDIRSLSNPSEVCGLLPDTVTELKIYMISSDEMNKNFPRLKELWANIFVVSDSTPCPNLIKCSVDHLICADLYKLAEMLPSLQEVERELDLRDLPEIERWPDLRTCRDAGSVQAMLNLPELKNLTLWIKRSPGRNSGRGVREFSHRKNINFVVNNAFALQVSDCGDGRYATSFL